MVILGLSAYAHDSAAAVVDNGRVVAVCEEERLDRVKHSGAFPHQAVTAALRLAGLDGPGGVDRVAFFLDPALVRARVESLARDHWPKGAVEWARNGRNARRLEPRLRADLAGCGLGHVPLEFVEHHYAHAVSAALASGFRRCALLTADGKGEWGATTLGRYAARRVTLHEEIRYPHSLGYLYSVITRFLGFRPWGGEGKVMGLAAYGEPNFGKKIDALCPAQPDGTYRLDLRYFRHHLGLPWVGPRLVELLGPPRPPESELTQRHYDLAASLQQVFEQRLLALAQRVREQSGETRLACAGGVFLNGVANWRLRTESGFDEVFVHPVSHDAGTALGAAQAVALAAGERPDEPLGPLFLGPGLDPASTEAAVRGSGLVFERCADPAGRASRLIAEGQVVGWVQGRSEVGPRALGARSILADPRRADMKDVVNHRVKRREGFRPFAPAVLAERCGEWFTDAGPFPYMIVVVPVRPERAADIPAVVHADGTGRVQTVDAQTNPGFHHLIERFADRTGVPVLLNTSFNLRGEAMVQSAADALDCMKRTDLDHCFIGEWYVCKEPAGVESRELRVESRAFESEESGSRL